MLIKSIFLNTLKVHLYCIAPPRRKNVRLYTAGYICRNISAVKSFQRCAKFKPLLIRHFYIQASMSSYERIKYHFERTKVCPELTCLGCKWWDNLLDT